MLVSASIILQEVVLLAKYVQEAIEKEAGLFLYQMRLYGRFMGSFEVSAGSESSLIRARPLTGVVLISRALP